MSQNTIRGSNDERIFAFEDTFHNETVSWLSTAAERQYFYVICAAMLVLCLLICCVSMLLCYHDQNKTRRMEIQLELKKLKRLEISHTITPQHSNNVDSPSLLHRKVKTNETKTYNIRHSASELAHLRTLSNNSNVSHISLKSHNPPPPNLPRLTHFKGIHSANHLELPMWHRFNTLHTQNGVNVYPISSTNAAHGQVHPISLSDHASNNSNKIQNGKSKNSAKSPKRMQKLKSEYAKKENAEGSDHELAGMLSSDDHDSMYETSADKRTTQPYWTNGE